MAILFLGVSFVWPVQLFDSKVKTVSGYRMMMIITLCLIMYNQILYCVSKRLEMIMKRVKPEETVAAKV